MTKFVTNQRSYSNHKETQIIPQKNGQRTWTVDIKLNINGP